VKYARAQPDLPAQQTYPGLCSRRSNEPFVLAFVDVDGLKKLNAREGHAAGGLAMLGDPDSLDKLIARADADMYAGKDRARHAP
jgi:GGDEF domain-containing protein